MVVAWPSPATAASRASRPGASMPSSLVSKNLIPPLLLLGRAGPSVDAGAAILLRWRAVSRPATAGGPLRAAHHPGLQRRPGIAFGAALAGARARLRSADHLHQPRPGDLPGAFGRIG